MGTEALPIDIRIDPAPAPDAFATLWQAAWGATWSGDLDAIWKRSLAHLGAYAGDRLVGYVNIAWDGGVHAFILDTSVHPDFQRHGVGRQLVEEAALIAGARGAHWLHVDYEPQLEDFYAACGFRPTKAGLIQLA